MSNRVSDDQVNLLIQYLTSYRYLATGVGAGARSKETIDRQWESLASKLNALGSGSSKNGDRWKKYWGDIKFKARNRAALNNVDLKGTAGGPPNKKSKMTATDHKVLAILGPEAVFGDAEHRVPLFNSHTQSRATAESEENCGDSPLTVAVEEEYQVPLFTSQPATNILVAEVEDEIAAGHGPAMPINPCSPSTSGQTTTKAGDAENIERHSHYKSTARRLFPPAEIDSPVSTHRTRANRIRCHRTSNQVKANPTWVIELERKRVEAEENLAKAALVTAQAAHVQAEASLVQAEASRVQAEVARSQVEMARILAESVATLAKLLKDKK